MKKLEEAQKYLADLKRTLGEGVISDQLIMAQLGVKVAALERQLDEAKTNHEAEIIDLKAELEDDRQVVNEAMNDIWGIVYPGKDDWDYFGMVFRHINALVGELRAKNAAMEEAVKKESSRALETIQDVQRECPIGGGETDRIVYAAMTTLSCTIGRLLREAQSEGDDGKN